MGYGVVIKEILRSKGMTIKELAEFSGTSVYTLYTITKNDPKRINSDTLLKISSALGAEPYELTPGYVAQTKRQEEREAKRRQLKALLLELYGEKVEAVVEQAAQLTIEGQGKLSEYAELLVLRYNQAAVESKADAAKERPEYHGLSEEV